MTDTQDELVDCIRDMEVMEQQLQDYSNIITTQQNTIEGMTPTMMIEKQWAKNWDKRRGDMEWLIGVDKLVIKMLAN